MNWKADYELLGSALAAASNDPSEVERLQSTHPILSARAVLKITSVQIAAHAKKLLESRGHVGAVRVELTQDYPFVARAVKEKDDSLKQLDEFSAVLMKQMTLAKAHSELFEFAAKSNINVEKAFGAIVSDQGLQGEVLGLIKDDKWKATATDAFTALTGLLQKETDAKVAEVK